MSKPPRRNRLQRVLWLRRSQCQRSRSNLRLPQQRPDQTPPPPLADELVRATEMLYTLGERETVVRLAADLGDDSNDVPTISAVA